MKDYKVLEDLLNTHMRAYENGFNTVNTDWEIKFTLTITPHKVNVGQVTRDVEYLRLERSVRPKSKDSTNTDWESILIYNQAYKFKDISERIDASKPWMYVLYQDLIGRLISGGLEYSELIKRAKDAQKNTKAISELITPTKPDIIVTDQMPEPLTEDEKKYREYINKQKQL